MGKSAWDFKAIWGDIGSLENAEMTVVVAEQVAVRERDGKRHLVSVGKAREKRAKPLRIGLESERTDFNLAMSLINLVQDDENLPLDFLALMQSISEDAAAAWVEKNGFPEVDLFDFDCEDAFCWLSLERFCRETSMLYFLLGLWVAMLDEDERRISRYLRFFSEWIFAGKKNFHSIEEKDLYPIVQHIMGKRLSGISPRFRFEEGNPVIYLEANSLFAVAFFQLAQLMTKLDDDSKRKHLKKCPVEEGGCGNLFWGHGNRKFCPNCPRSTTLYRRKKRKAGALTGKG